MEQELRSTFLLANVAYRHRSNFLRCKQGKRSLQDYVMEFHNLEATMAGASLSEDVTVTVFMDVVRTGPVSSAPASQKEQVPGTTLLCLSVAAARSNLVVVTASMKAYLERPDRFRSAFNFATKASVARNNALYASAFTIGASHNPLADRALVGHIPSSSRGGFVHEHRVPRDERQFAGSSEDLELPMVSPPRAREHEVGDGEEPQDPNTSPMGRQGFAVCNRVAFVQGTVTTQAADAAAARAGRGGSVRAPPTLRVVAGSAHVEKCAGVVARANMSGQVGAPTTQGVPRCGFGG
ncbi:unnamed protein product [Phytophthora fragariaefolia]|uniref:Unnamed protein product n=1 Tax=Phytophthora fragariaefolia TaxID=1490495 RepID=A0A9W6TN90_9STRA|nr:unnamed protein product [Phytophthora fragariaefolia]